MLIFSFFLLNVIMALLHYFQCFKKMTNIKGLYSASLPYIRTLGSDARQGVETRGIEEISVIEMRVPFLRRFMWPDFTILTKIF